jgi:glycosyltransferase involved in cell wall biosynthesis
MSHSLRVCVSTISRFHAFSLAEQLQKRGCLERLLVSWFNPETIAKGYDIDPARVRHNILFYGLDRLPHKTRLLRRFASDFQYLAAEMFDRWASRRLPECDVYVGWSGYSLRGLRRARKRGAVTVLERGSTHIAAQRDLLVEEAARWDLALPADALPDPRMIAKEMREYEEADYIAIPSTFVKRTFVAQGVPEEKLIQVPYGADLTKFHPVPKQDDVFRITHIGGSIRKGTHYLLQALTELNLPNSELVLIGTPDPVVERFLAEYPGRLVRVRGVPQTELYRYYSNSSVYALPSIEEGLAMAQLEAMACSVPILCSTNTGGEDVVRDGVDGFVVPVRDVAALKERLVTLHSDEDRRRAMGLSAGRRAAEFTWDRYGEEILARYRQIWGERHQ